MKSVNRRVVETLITILLFTINTRLLSQQVRNGSTALTTPSLETAESWINQQGKFGFTENKGQITDGKNNLAPYVLFKAEAPNLNIWVTTTGLTYQFFTMDKKLLFNANGSPNLEADGQQKKERKIHWNRVDMVLKNAKIKKKNVVVCDLKNTGEQNFYLPHCPKGIQHVKTYTKIVVKEIYNGIDWVLYTSENGTLKHDFVVHSHANPNQIRLIYEGSGDFEIQNNQIHFVNKLGELTEGSLLCYQGGEANTIISSYSAMKNEQLTYAGVGNENKINVKPDFLKEYSTQVFSYEVGINLQAYNKSKQLIVDPNLVWSTYFGGNGLEGPMSLDVDINNNVFITGYTGSNNVGFPFQPWGAAYQQTTTGIVTTIFIMKFSSVGALQWATFYGGEWDQNPYSITTDFLGNIFVTGSTASGFFPTVNRPGAYNQATVTATDIFILKFLPDGTRQWATYYGGPGNQIGYSITTDNLGNIYVTGNTSAGFTAQNLASAYNQATYGGGSTDIILVKFLANGSLQWATNIGGNDTDIGYAIATDNIGNIYITGVTASSNFPLQSSGNYNQTIKGGMLDALICKFSPTGAMLWSTYYGGSNDDFGFSLITDNMNNVFIAGKTVSNNFPTLSWTTAYNQATYGGGGGDAFLIKLLPSTNRQWATYYGGNRHEINSYVVYDLLTVDACGSLYFSIHTEGNMPTHTSLSGYDDNTYGGGTDQYISKFSPVGARVWDSYIGGDGLDARLPLGIDNTGNLIVSGEWRVVNTGNTSTYSFVNPAGGAYFDNTHNGSDDGLIMKFTAIPINAASFNTTQVNSTTCSPCNGTATVAVTSGDPSFDYEWSTGNSYLNLSSNTNTITGLCPGTYSVTITSSCYQKHTLTYTITGTNCNVITANVNSADMCNGATPCPTITATGGSGTQPYTYSWNTGANTQNINPCPLTTTTYTVTIKDNTGATATSTATITVYPAVTASTTTGIISCSGDKGQIKVTGADGTSPYTFSWSTGATTTGTSSTIPNLSANTYSVIVTDANGCTTTTSVLLTDPPPLLGQFTKGTAACSNCGCQEWIMATSTGGTPPYDYQWSDGYDKRYKNKVCPGNYTVKVTDKNGCSVNVNVSTP